MDSYLVGNSKVLAYLYKTIHLLAVYYLADSYKITTFLSNSYKIISFFAKFLHHSHFVARFLQVVQFLSNAYEIADFVCQILTRSFCSSTSSNKKRWGPNFKFFKCVCIFNRHWQLYIQLQTVLNRRKKLLTNFKNSIFHFFAQSVLVFAHRL